MTRIEEVQQKVRVAAQAFDEAMQGRDIERLETEPVCGIWSARDVAAHLTDWNSELLACARHALGGRAPLGHPIMEDEPFNTDHARAHQNEPWQVSKAAFDTSVAYTIDLLGSMNDEDLNKPATLPWDDVATVASVFNDIAGHIQEHVDGLER